MGAEINSKGYRESDNGFIKLDGEHRAAVRTVRGADGSVLRRHDRLRQGKPDADALRRGVFALVKAVKQIEDIFRCKALAGVGDFDLCEQRGFFGGYGDFTAVRRVLHTVFDEVPDGFRRPKQIAAEVLVADRKLQILSAQLHGDPKRLSRAFYDVAHRGLVRTKLHGAGVDF